MKKNDPKMTKKNDSVPLQKELINPGPTQEGSTMFSKSTWLFVRPGAYACGSFAFCHAVLAVYSGEENGCGVRTYILLPD